MSRRRARTSGAGSIREWPEGERPRERLMRHGVEALTDAELLAILLRSGTAARSALDLARELLQQAGSLRALGRIDARALTERKGIGAAKAAGLLAAIELGRRVMAGGDDPRPVFRSPAEVAAHIIPRLRDLQQEVFLVMVLDAKNAVKHEEVLTRGTLNASLVHPREVFKTAVDRRGAALIVAHNHPSGNPDPSREDLEITRQLAKAGELLGIPLHDHLIVAGDRFVSLAERGDL